MASLDVLPPDNVALASTSVAPTRKGGHAIRTRKLLKFTIFGKLPLELRELVWTEVCFHERLIDIWCVDVFGSPDGDRFFKKVYFKSYKYGDVRIEVSSPAQIYVNWNCDIICPQTVNQSLSPEEEEMNNVFWHTPLFTKICRIAFEVGLGDVDHWDPGHILSSHNILEVKLYPAINRCELTERLHDDKGVITRKRMSIELVSLDAYLDGGAFPDRFKIANTGILEQTHEKIRKR
ncbi:hypothetical protein WAI453_004943 [Rhynchosporium graminicola]